MLQISHKLTYGLFLSLFVLASFACGETEETMMMTSADRFGAVVDPATVDVVAVDRFSEAAATLMVRTADNGLPGANKAVDFDSGEPFITKGLGPDGENVQYYNFDVQPLAPAPIFVLFREGEDTPVEGQMNIIDVIPGEEGYNDFWHVHKVTVPADYQANSITSFSEIQEQGLKMEATDIIVNCPVVPDGSTAKLRAGDETAGLVSGWYRDQVVKYFVFEEAKLKITADGTVPLADILVTFNVNPDENNPDSGPASGFMTEAGTAQTHNVIDTLPSDAAYSPLWHVDVYDNADFNQVSDYATAMTATILAEGVAHVNCPVVDIM